MAADRGDAEAKFQVGGMYWFGRGVKKDCVKAIKWWRKAADAGYRNAQGSIGDVYSTANAVLNKISPKLITSGTACGARHF